MSSGLHSHNAQRSTPRRGFTLIETVLGLLVASVGLTAVMALIPYAMGQGKRSGDDTYAAFLADAAFASFRTASESRKISWDGLSSYAAIAPVTISGGQDLFWKNSAALALAADGALHTQLFVAASTDGKWDGATWPLPASWEQYDHGLRYRLTVRDQSVRRKSLTLEVWPGEYGPVASTNAQVFYTEIFNHGI